MITGTGEHSVPRQPLLGFGLRIMLVVLVVLAATQALGTFLSMLSFEKAYLKTISATYEILGKSLKRKIEQSLVLGKSLEHFVGMGRLAAPLYEQLPDLDEIFLADPGGRLIFNSNKDQVIAAKGLSYSGDFPAEISSGQLPIPDSVEIQAIFDGKESSSLVRPHAGRYYVMLPIQAGYGEQRAVLGLVFNRSTIEERKLDLLRSARLTLTLSILITAILIGLLIHHLFLKPAARQMRAISAGLFQEAPRTAMSHQQIPAELMEINSRIANFVAQVYAFRHEAVFLLNQLSSAVPDDSVTAAHIGQMKRILVRKADEDTGTES